MIGESIITYVWLTLNFFKKVKFELKFLELEDIFDYI